VIEEQPGAETPSFAATLNRRGVVREAQARDAEAEARAAHDWRAVLRRRMLVLVAIGVAWGVAIEARLVNLQVFQHEELVARADRQRLRTITISGKRGELVDRDGRILAYSVDGDAVFAEPVHIQDPPAVAAKVCEAIQDCTPRDRELMTQRLSRRAPFAYLERRISPADAARVLALGIRGIGVLKEDRRFYPNRELGAHVIGYVGLENKGLGGIEAAFDSQIAGRPGVVLLQADARSHAFHQRIQRPPTAGSTFELTLDSYLQYVAERELQNGVREFNARGGTIVVMEPKSGDILALANWPTFNPNVFQGVSDERRRNRAVQEIYEPGSTFKIVTASAALEEGLYKATDPFDVSAGVIRFGSRTISDVHRYGTLSFHDVIVKSSNVGAIKMGLGLGPMRLGDYVSRFGFGQLVLKDLAGESRGIVWNPAKLSDSALASVSMGYQIGVTPVQMATATSAIANGGEVVAPRVVRAVISGSRRVEEPRRSVRQAIRPETAAAMTAIMEAVVEVGTAKAARIPGYTIAGKTGTSAKLENGRYSKVHYNASFIGFLPSRDPAVTILVVIDSPRGKGFYGGAVAAPIFKRVAEAAMRHLGIGPSINPGPRLLVARRGSDPGTQMVAPANVRQTSVLDARAAMPPDRSVMPDLRGMSAREAAQALARIGLVGRLVGEGFVLHQDIAPGEPVEEGLTCVLTLDRRAAVPVVGPTP
jgi:cell division protein FtsI (penicillin-binding protein 3)